VNSNLVSLTWHTGLWKRLKYKENILFQTNKNQTSMH
jgi:hypothetical protein